MAKIWKEYMKAYYTAIPTPAGTLITPSPEEKDTTKSDEKLAKDGETPLLLPGLKLGGNEDPKPAADAAVAKEALEKPRAETSASTPAVAPVATPAVETPKEAPQVAPEPVSTPSPSPAPAPSPSTSTSPTAPAPGTTNTFIAPSTPASRSKFSPYDAKPAFAPADPSAATPH